MGTRKLPRYLSLEEIKEMFGVAVGNPRDLMLLELLFYSGLRNTEARTQRIENVDFINRVIFVKEGKGRKDRNVPIPKYLAERLREYTRGRESGWLFGGRDMNGCISATHLRRIVKKCAIVAGLRHASEVHPHTLRHSYATFLHDHNIDLRTIQENLGHADIVSTSIYVHVSTRLRKESIDKAFSESV